MATFFADAEVPTSETFDPATVAVEFTVPAGTANRFRAFFPALASGTTPLFRLYDAGGAVIASGPFDTTVDDAWNWFTPGVPIHLAAGTYRVARYTSRYTYTAGLLAAPITRGGVTANRGMFASGADAAPNSSSTAWYGLDIDFTPDAGPVVVPDPVSGGTGTGGALDGRALGDGSSGSGTGGTSGGVALGDSSGSGGSGGSLDGRALGDGSGGAGTGGSPDTITGPVVIFDSSGGAGTGGSADQVSSGSLVVHDTMVMPILLQARACLVAEVGKLQFPPKRVQIRPGASFEFQADATTNECCDGIAWVRRGQLIPTANFPDQISDARPDGPGQYAIQLEIGIERCVPVAANAAGDIVTEAQWLQAAINAEDDGAALRRVACCLRDVYGARSVIENPVVALENGGLCGGQIMTLLVRALACDCVE